jgi:hypothetical protein
MMQVQRIIYQIKEFGKTANFRIAKQNELKDSEE